MIMGFGVANLFRVAGAAEKVIAMMKMRPETINPKGGDTIPDD